MPISAPPTIPQITDPYTFATRAQAWVVWQSSELYPAIADTASILSLSTSSTSTTSNTIGTGSKSFTVETGKGYLAGQSLSIAYTTTPTNRMFAVVTSYNSVTGALVVDVQAIEGSGTFTDWSIALAFNGVIANAQVPNNELTLNKLARVGTAGQVLTSGGAGADASYQDAIASNAEYVTGTDNTKFLTPLVARSRNIVQGTAVTASGTAIDFTGIPSWAKRITVMFNGVSTNGTALTTIQIGGAGGIDPSGYAGVCANIGSTTASYSNLSSGFSTIQTGGATIVQQGYVVLNLLSGNTWVASGFMGRSDNTFFGFVSGSKTLSDTLTRIRITTSNGTDTFDAGSINISYE